MGDPELSYVKYPSFENLARKLQGRDLISTTDLFVATEKLDGGNAGIVVDTLEGKVVRIQSRGRSGGPPPVIYPNPKKPNILKADVAGCIIAQKDPSIYEKIIDAAKSIASTFSSPLNLVTIFGEAYKGTFYPFAAAIHGDPALENEEDEEGAQPSTSSIPASDSAATSAATATATATETGAEVDPASATASEIGPHRFLQMSTMLHELFLSHKLTPPELLGPMTILEMVKHIEPKLYTADKEDVEYEGIFITCNNPAPVTSANLKGMKLKSSTHEEQPSLPFQVDEVIDPVHQEIAKILERVFATRGKKKKSASAASAASSSSTAVDVEALTNQVNLALKSVMSKHPQSQEEIRALDQPQKLALMKTVVADTLADVNEQFSKVNIALPDQKALAATTKKVVSELFFSKK